MILEPLCTLLDQAALGVPVFQDYMAPTIDRGIVLLSTLAGNHIDWEMPLWRRNDPFQVIVRSTTVTDGRELAYQVRDILTFSSRLLSAEAGLPALLMTYSRPTCDPIVYPRQTGNLWEVSSNFQASYAIQRP